MLFEEGVMLGRVVDANEAEAQFRQDGMDELFHCSLGFLCIAKCHGIRPWTGQSIRVRSK